jgi:Arc/MetJ-type ribon-helix-helix transcriptional regulator
MIVGMTTKIAVSLPDEQVAAARKAVAEGRAASVSAYVAEALAQRRADEDLAVLLEELDAEYGPPTGEHYAWARRALGLAG